MGESICQYRVTSFVLSVFFYRNFLNYMKLCMCAMHYLPSMSFLWDARVKATTDKHAISVDPDQLAQPIILISLQQCYIDTAESENFFSMLASGRLSCDAVT